MTLDAYRNPSSSIGERVDDLLGRMNLDEKLAQLGGVWLADLFRGDHFDPDGVLAVIPNGIGQVTRIGATTGLRPGESAELMNSIQRLMVERTRLGIPVMVHEESLGGYCARDATVFPQAIALASTWDPGLVEEVAQVIRRQMMAVGARQALAPVLDVARDPRWGRVEETYGEDPVLAGILGTAYVAGLQSRDLKSGVLATGKHFLGHGMPEGGRNHAPVHFGPRELREVYAEPFAAAIRDARLGSMMNSYSSVDGLACAGSRQILTELLRSELGFSGMVVSDYFAVSLLVTHHHVACDKADAARQALSAGLDVELPAVDCFGEPLRRAIAEAVVPMALVDTAVRRVLACKFRLGLFESPYVDPGRARSVFSDPANAVLARRVATAGVVLLTNDGTLPLSPIISRVAVIGPGADDQRLLQGDYHYPAHQEILIEENAGVAQGGPILLQGDLAFLPRSGGSFRPGRYYNAHVTPLAGIRAGLGPRATVVYAPGCSVDDDDRAGFGLAVEAASSAEVAVVVVAGRSGLHKTSTVGEARDAADLRLTGVQEDLVSAICATGTPTVVVVMSGRAHALTGIAEQASALLQVWPPGEQGGNAIADVLLGRANPAGRLPVSLPRGVGQVPTYHSHRSGGSRSMFYGDYTDSPTTPLFVFGHGLSYTTFAYTNLEVSANDTESMVSVSLDVANTGGFSGEEVVQLYVTDVVASVARPERALLGFARLELDQGTARRITFQVHPSRLAFYDEAMRFVVEPGEFRFSVGASSADIRAEVMVELLGGIAQYAQRSVVPLEVVTGEPFFCRVVET
jgi:beta-glucosidase